jgi:hypothetical protein
MAEVTATTEAAEEADRRALTTRHKAAPGTPGAYEPYEAALRGMTALEASAVAVREAAAERKEAEAAATERREEAAARSQAALLEEDRRRQARLTACDCVAEDATLLAKAWGRQLTATARAAKTAARQPAPSTEEELAAAKRRLRARTQGDKDRQEHTSAGSTCDSRWTPDALEERRLAVQTAREPKQRKTRELGLQLQGARQGGAMPSELRPRTPLQTKAEAAASLLVKRVVRHTSEAQEALQKAQHAATQEEAHATREKARGWTDEEARRKAQAAKEAVKLMRAGAPMSEVNLAARGNPQLRPQEEPARQKRRKTAAARAVQALPLQAAAPAATPPAAPATATTTTSRQAAAKARSASSSSTTSSKSSDGDSSSSLSSLSSSARRALEVSVATDTATLKASGQRKSFAAKAATAAAKQERTTQRKAAAKQTKAKQRELQARANHWHEEGFGQPRAGWPLPNRSSSAPLGDSVFVDEVAGVRIYSGRGSMSNQRGLQMEFL